MAVVTATFTKSRGGAKASIGYIAFRPGRNGEKMSRQLFGHDGPLSIFQAEGIIDEAPKGTNFFRLVLSPDPKKEDRLNMWELAKQTILKLERRLKREIQFVATEHNDHTPIRHVHVIALIQGKLNVADLEALRIASTKEALFQRQERDLALAYLELEQSRIPRTGLQAREAVPVRPFARTVYPSDRAYREGPRVLDDRMPASTPRGSGAATQLKSSRNKPWSDVTICHLCGKRVGKGFTKCYNCGARLEISLELGDNGLSYDWD
jgi:hypothetical protein